MITMEKLTAGTEEGRDTLADTIIALMKRAYENGHERGYAAAHQNGWQEGYSRGREDGYDEACMDLTDDDLHGARAEDCGPCFGASFGDCSECQDKPQATDCPWA